MDRRLSGQSLSDGPAKRPGAAPAPRSRGRRLAGRALLVAVVVGMHACVVREVTQRMVDFETAAAMPARIELVYGREMEFSAPPVAPLAPAPAAVPVVPRPERQATPVASAASAAAKPRPKPPRPEVATAAQAPADASAPEVSDDALAQADPARGDAPDAAASSSDSTVAGAPTGGLAAVAVAAAASAGSPGGTVVGPSQPATARTASAEPAQGLAAAAPPASAASGARFEWPPSTRITYVLTGNYRGEVHGSAQVDWVRVGARYQVHLDVLIGLKFAPIYSRRMSSEGQLTEGGLFPERYDEDSKAAFKDHRRAQVLFEPDAVVLSKGQRLERWPGVQDSASQFVQMSYLFTRRPELLTPGGTVEMPLALPRNQRVWVYDVRAPEMIDTAFGWVEAVPLQPRSLARKGDDLTAEVWFAPSLRYLPVRIRIRQDEETYMDLVIERRPQLAN